LPKSQGGQGFPDKIARGSPILGFIASIFIRLLKILWGEGAMLYFISPEPLCASMVLFVVRYSLKKDLQTFFEYEIVIFWIFK
jgi:hypothetical protein